MSVVTENVARYIQEKGISITKMATATKIEYNPLYDSLGVKGRRRDLRDAELIAVCKFLGKNPMDFADDLAEET